MGGLGSAELQPRHHSPNVGGSMILESDHRPKRMGEPMPKVVRSSISHQKLPNDPESLELVRGVLEALSFRFSDGRVSVDTATANAARIWKLYGTTARKGDSTEDRPHRVSKLLKVPEQRTEVSRDQL